MHNMEMTPSWLFPHVEWKRHFFILTFCIDICPFVNNFLNDVSVFTSSYVNEYNNFALFAPRLKTLKNQKKDNFFYIVRKKI
jgi:hypothetical protein